MTNDDDEALCDANKSNPFTMMMIMMTGTESCEHHPAHQVAAVTSVASGILRQQ